MSTPLGEFVRARRDATSPEALGLSAGPRRRAPGVRRVELATLAGISVEYLIRIEQGRDRNPSGPVVRALADALRLDAAERQHIQYLAKVTAGACTGFGSHEPAPDVRRPVLAMLDQLEPGIAVVTNRLGDLLAYTSGFALMARPIGLLDADRPNLTRYVLTDERAKSAFPDWDSVADQQAFDLRLGPSVRQATELTAELRAIVGDELGRRLSRHTMPDRGPVRLRHPIVGDLLFDREIFELQPADAQQLVVFLPADDTTRAAVHALMPSESARRAGERVEQPMLDLVERPPDGPDRHGVLAER